MKLFLCLGTVLLLTSCTSDSSISTEADGGDSFMQCHSGPSGIVNGSKVAQQDPDSKQAVLLIIRSDEGLQACTGAPITDTVILTAAHCLKGAAKNGVSVVFHTDMTCASGYDISKSINSTDLIIHENYDPEAAAKYDLGLVKLEKPIPSSYPIQSIYDGESSLSSDTVLMIGYGVTKEKGRDSTVLRKVTKSFKTQTSVKDSRIGFDQSGTSGGVCSGDSGGPLYVQVNGQYKIIGVNSVVTSSTSEKACHGASIGMYMPKFADWVNENIPKLQ